MASDISRLIFNENKRYSGVRLQQGRVMLDSDWNAQHDINQNRLHTQTIDVIGKCGVPKGNDGFKIFQNGVKLEIKPGRIYINGLLCELNESATINNLSAPQLIQGDEYSPPHGSVFSELKEGTYFIYIDAWQREINYLQDPEIQEKALGEADTTARLQSVWKVNSKLVEPGINCDGVSKIWQDFINPPTGTLEAQTTDSTANIDPCDLQQSGGYRRLENQLYRIEIQQGGDLSNATFKWSRDNGSVEVKIESFIGTDIIKVSSLGKDDILGFHQGDWVEVIDHRKSLDRESNGLLKILSIDPNSLEITVDNANNVVLSEGIKLRRWDQPSNSPATGIALADSFLAVEDGIEVKFSAGTYRTGDYWLIPARTLSSSIEWPIGVKKSPFGLKIGYCKLAIVTVSHGAIQGVEDCRPTFPTLTDLCEVTGQCCTYHVSPDSGWESVFDKIGPNEDAMICFEVGEYKLSRTKDISNKGHLRLVGSGPGTKIVAIKQQVALRFSNCRYVSISDLTATTETVKNEDRKDVVSLKGTFTFVNTNNVHINRIQIRCGHGLKPEASCINVFNSKANAGIVTIENSILLIGYYQHGIIVINSARAIIQNNIIKAYRKPQSNKLYNRFNDKRTRVAIKRLMVSNVSARSNSKTNTTIKHGKRSISFRTDPQIIVEKAWERILVSDPPVGIKNHKDFQKYIEEKALSIMRAPKLIAASSFNNFFARLKRQDPAVAYQGITIGGEKASDVHVLGNKIENVFQGIHVGLSHHDTKNINDVIKSAKIDKNIICNILPPTTNYGRHGIFVGNCESLSINDNEIELKRLSNTIKIDGIRVWGRLGKKITITNNHIFGTSEKIGGYNVGIRINPIHDVAKNTKWGVTWNVAPSINNTYKIPNNVFKKYLDTNSP